MKKIIERIKAKAVKDDNAYWERQEQWIQRKNSSIRDVNFWHLCFFGAWCQLIFAVIVYVIF